jgi:hypothetical protein
MLDTVYVLVDMAGPIIGYSLGYMNLLHVIAVYGTLCKELGVPFRYVLAE